VVDYQASVLNIGLVKPVLGLLAEAYQMLIWLQVVQSTDKASIARPTRPGLGEGKMAEFGHSLIVGADRKPFVNAADASPD
jgi:hypothetical protein